MAAHDPLLDLVVDTAELDRTSIADALRGVIVIDKSGAVVPARDFQALSAQQKVIALLLGRKVAVLLGLSTDEAVGPTELAKQSDVPGGTIFPTVRRLLKDRMISQDSTSEYHLSTHQVAAAIAYLDTSSTSASSTPDPRPRNGAGKSATKPKRRKPNAPSAASTSTPKKRPGGGFSPTTAIRTLVEQGFFDKAKGLGAVQKRMKDKEGREVEVTTLSPIFTRLLRDGTLDREKNADGVYEYVRASKA